MTIIIMSCNSSRPPRRFAFYRTRRIAFRTPFDKLFFFFFPPQNLRCARSFSFINGSVSPRGAANGSATFGRTSCATKNRKKFTPAVQQHRKITNFTPFRKHRKKKNNPRRRPDAEMADFRATLAVVVSLTLLFRGATAGPLGYNTCYMGCKSAVKWYFTVGGGALITCEYSARWTGRASRGRNLGLRRARY